MTWPADRLSVQVLDDSTDPGTRALVARACADVRASTGVGCRVVWRADRQGYKAGALESRSPRDRRIGLPAQIGSLWSRDLPT